MARHYREYSLDQPLLLPPDLRDWIRPDHLVYTLVEVVATLDLRAIEAIYEAKDPRGWLPYHPRLLVALLFYGYCRGIIASRALEQATYEDLPCRVLTANQHPDHDTSADFRRRHLEALANLFDQIVRWCAEVGLVTLEHVAVDGTKIQADASKHKAMSYERLVLAEDRLQSESRALLAASERADQAANTAEIAAERQALAEEQARRQAKLANVQAAKAALEAESPAAAATQAAAAQEKLAARAQQAAAGKPPKGRAPQVPDPATATPKPTAQRNVTGPAARIMKDGATGGDIVGYNAQAVVDRKPQIIVAAAVSQVAADAPQLVPMLERTRQVMGHTPRTVTADTG